MSKPTLIQRAVPKEPADGQMDVGRVVDAILAREVASGIQPSGLSIAIASPRGLVDLSEKERVEASMLDENGELDPTFLSRPCPKEDIINV